MVNGEAQVSFQRYARGHVSLHLGLKKPQTVSTRCLGLVHGQVCALKQVVNGRSFFAKQCHTNAGAAMLGLVVQLVRLVQREQNLVAQQLRLCQ